jgi:competence protein ComEC
LVARDGRTVAVRLGDGRLAFVGRPSDRYAAENWLRRSGDERTPLQAIGGPGMACDSLGCIARGRGFVIAVEARAEALMEDCATATVVVSTSAAHGFCAGPKLIIDQADLLTNGAYAVRFGNVWRVETVVQLRGRRPWSMPP